MAVTQDSVLIDLGINLLEEDIDEVIFRTNEFLTDQTFIESQGPFWYIIQLSMCLATLFAVITCTYMGYKMMVKHEPLDVMKLFRPFIFSVILCWWYPPSMTRIVNDNIGGNVNWCVLDFISYIPNCIGSYTYVLYEAEAAQVQDRFEQVQELMYKRQEMMDAEEAKATATDSQVSDSSRKGAADGYLDINDIFSTVFSGKKMTITSATAGTMVMLDKIIMTLALITYRIGWWGTIYCQQILLGMLTIFGPIQMAFSLLPKWEGAWAKWLIRYLTVHFYGAMLYFVGFYVLLLFDIVISIQYNDLMAITVDEQTMGQYIKNCFFSSGYLMAASVVSLKCLNLVPDLAAWMIPEGETAFSTRNFGEGVGSEMGRTAKGAVGKLFR